MQNRRKKLRGDWYELPFADPDHRERVAAVYESLAERHSPDEILVLKRIPAALDALERTLQNRCRATTRPHVESLPAYASHVVEIHEPEVDLLSYEQRIELLARVIDRADWEDIVTECRTSERPYAWPQHETTGQLVQFLERASQQDNFGRDLGQLLLEATRKGGFQETDQPLHVLLGVFQEINDQFHTLLDDRGYVERRRLVPRAAEVLEDDRTRAAVEAEFEALLVVEFEECSPTDRDLLGALTENAELAVVVTPHASVQRTETEARSLAEVVADHDLTRRRIPDDSLAGGTASPDDGGDEGFGGDGSTEESGDDSLDGAAGSSGDDSGGATPPHLAIAEFLATGTTDREEGHAYYLAGETFDEQLSRVANEIELLAAEEGWAYRDFAVVVNRLGTRLADARRQLRVNDLPTRTVGMPALRDDPVVTECYAFVRYLLNRDELAENWLDARVPEFSADLATACDTGGIRPSLDRWIVNSGLKERVADRESHLDAKAQFENLDRIRDLARFVDETDLVGDGWATFRDVFEQALRFDAGYAHDLDVTPRDEGVTVTDVRGVKYDSFECVFLLDVIDGEYPGSNHFTNLFPTPWLESMPAFPGVTQPSADEITATFPEAAETDAVLADAFDAYHRFRERRKLAIGTRAAASRLYFCSYETTGGGLAKTHNDSRYLELVRDEFDIETIPGDSDDDSRPLLTRKNVSSRVFGEPWKELERVVQAAYIGTREDEAVDLEDSEEVFGAVRTLLDDPDLDPVFAEAIRTQFALARGEVVADE